MLGDAHAVADGRSRGFRELPGQFDDILGCDPGDLLYPFRGIGSHHIPDSFKIFRTVGNKGFVVEIFLDDHVHQPVEPGNVGTRMRPQPFDGKVGQLDAPGIDHV